MDGYDLMLKRIPSSITENLSFKSAFLLPTATRRDESAVKKPCYLLEQRQQVPLAIAFQDNEERYGGTQPYRGDCSYCHQNLAIKLNMSIEQKKNMDSTQCLQAFSKRRMHTLSTQDANRQELHRVFIAFGSNVGNRLRYIENAIRQLSAHDRIRVKKTSGIWQTRAMYFLDQKDFLNGVCEIETDLEPLQLLDVLQAIEQSLDRVKSVDKGPRTIDLDILLYDEAVIEHERLSIPHKLMSERPFVLYPLSELLPLEHSFFSGIGEQRKSITVAECISNLPSIADSNPAPSLIFPISTASVDAPPLVLRPLQPTRCTQLMAILNLTPDSFSDGGEHPPGSIDLNTLMLTILSQLRSGATIVDIGGQSSRPGARPISAEEEISRVLPIISHLHTLANSPSWPVDVPKPIISIDTYRAPVARAAVLAGANIVNDISGGYLDPDMLPSLGSLFREHGKQCSVILMHMRGDPQTMSRKQHVLYPRHSDGVATDEGHPPGLIAAIASELAVRVQAAEKAGIPRWRILLDPGVGFAKAGEQNCELLRSLGSLRPHPSLMSHQDSQQCFRSKANLAGLPLVVGVSRKKFIGTLSDISLSSPPLDEKRDSKRGRMGDRAWGTAAAVTACVAGGADIVRVHDVAEMKRVVSVADAIWRR